MSTTMENSTRTGTRDVTYNLISVAYHALQGIETYGIYAQDAESAGNPELRAFFERAQQINRELADEAKRQLAHLLEQGMAQSR